VSSRLGRWSSQDEVQHRPDRTNGPRQLSKASALYGPNLSPNKRISLRVSTSTLPLNLLSEILLFRRSFPTSPLRHGHSFSATRPGGKCHSCRRPGSSSAQPANFSVQLFHALLQRFPILTQQRDRLNVAAFVASRFEIVNVPPELLRQRIDLIRGWIAGRRSLYSRLFHGISSEATNRTGIRSRHDSNVDLVKRPTTTPTAIP
jgi:hypothetical protein